MSRRKLIDKDHYTLEPIDIVYRINTYPLKLSTTLLEKAGRELGESFGVNIEFMCKDPSLFDQTDWDTWMEKIDCFYLDSLGRFNRSPFVLEKQGAMQFSGCYFFVRKRLEKSVMEHKLSDEEFESEMQMGTARMALFCHFDWMQNNDLRLTQEADDVPMTDSQVSP